MVDHDDRRVDDDAERDRDARQRVDVNVQPEQVVEDHGDQDVHHERHQDDEQVAQVAADQEDEQQQDRHAQQRPDVYFLQLSGDVAGGVVVDRAGAAEDPLAGAPSPRGPPRRRAACSYGLRRRPRG